MNRDCIEGALKLLRGELRQQWGRFTDDQSAVEQGRHDRLRGGAQFRHGLSQQAEQRQLRNFLRRNRDWTNLSR